MMKKPIESMAALSEQLGRPARFMEVCGTHTMAAFRTGLRSLLPEGVSLISGPGCPVCVTTTSYIDKAVAIAGTAGTSVYTFGDMLKVPGTESSLEQARAGGSDVNIVYSPIDALDAAKAHPDIRTVFLGVGFETTTPTVGWTIRKAKEDGVGNYSVLCAHKTIPEAMTVLLESGDVAIDGFMCPGHVSVITGSQIYEPISRDQGVPCVVAGFEIGDMASAIEMLLKQIVQNRSAVEIQYTRSVTRTGNAAAQELCNALFDKSDAQWRGIGTIPGSGLKLKDEFAEHDAGRIFADLELPEPVAPKGCMCGDVLRGTSRPTDCPLFREECSPSNPVGPCMVSSEGTCAAYFKYGETLEGSLSR